jgi:hypothetical protein
MEKSELNSESLLGASNDDNLATSEPIEDQTKPIEQPENKYKSDIHRLLLTLPEEELEYYNNNRDKLPGRLRMDRANELMLTNPELTLEDAYSRAYSEYEDVLLEDEQQEPVEVKSPGIAYDTSSEQVIDTTVKPVEQGYMRRGLNVLVRSATGLISGAMDTSIELSSGVARLFDYGFESLGGDLLDDDSWAYVYKEGLSEDFKESIESLAGIFPKGSSSLEQFTEELGTIILGGWALSSLAATGLAMKAGGAITGTKGVSGAIKWGSEFLGRHSFIKAAAKASVDGGIYDLSATLFSNPGTMVSLVGLISDETGEDVSEWFQSLDPMQRRGINLAEGLFMNTLMTFAKSYYKGLGMDVKNSEVERYVEDINELHKLSEAARKATQDVANKVAPERTLTAAELTDAAKKSASPVEPLERISEDIIDRTAVELKDKALTDIPKQISGKTDDILEDLSKRADDLLSDDALKKIEEAADEKSVVKTVDEPKQASHKAKRKAQKKPEADADAKAMELELKNPGVSVRDAKKAKKAVEIGLDEVIANASKDNVVPPVRITNKTKNYIGFGAKENTSGVYMENDLVGFIYNQIRPFVEKGSKSGVKFADMAFRGKPKGLTPAKCAQLCDELYTKCIRAIKGNNRGKITEIISNFKSKTIRIDKDFNVSVTDGAVLSESYFRKLMGELNMDSDKLTQHLSKERIPGLGKRAGTNVLLDMFNQKVGNTMADWLSVATKIASKSGIIGGFTAGVISNGLGIDVSGDNKVNFEDMAIVAGISMGFSYSVRAATKSRVVDKDIIIEAVKRGHGDFARTLMVARELATKATTVANNPRVAANATRIARAIEEYLFVDKKGLNDISSVLIDKVKAPGFGVSKVDEGSIKAIQDAVLRGTNSELSSGSPLKKFTLHDLSSVDSITKTFNDAYTSFSAALGAPEVQKKLLERSQEVRELASRIISEHEVPKAVADEWMSKPLGDLMALVNTSTSLLKAIDDEISSNYLKIDTAKKSLALKKAQAALKEAKANNIGVKEAENLVKRLTTSGDDLFIMDMTPNEVHDFARLIHQRRAVSEYIKSGGRVGSRLTKATAYVARSAILSMESETFLKRLSDHKDVLSTFSALRSKMINEGTISGPRLTKLINAVGADMSMGDMAVHLMYMSMFSHPRTWLLPAIENTINFGMTLTTESLSALSRGRYFDEIIGPNGLIKGMLDNLGLALRSTADRVAGEATSILSMGGKEFTDAKYAQIVSRTCGIDDPGMITSMFHRFADMMGFDPTDLTSAFDVFYRTVAYGGFENQKVIQKATDMLLTDHAGKHLDDVIKLVRSNSTLMKNIRAESLTAARRMSYTDAIEGSFTGKVVDFLNHPVVRLIVPIVKTPLVTARWVVSHTPIINRWLTTADRQAFAALATAKDAGAIRAAKRRVAEVNARAAAGIMATAATYYTLTSAGWEVIGTGEFDPELGAKLARGAKRFSLWNTKTGENISLERFSLFKATLGTVADLTHYWTHAPEEYQDEEHQHELLTSVGYFMYSMLTQAQPNQLEDVVDLWSGSQNGFGRFSNVVSDYTGDIISRFIPNIFRVEGKASDDVQRAYTGNLDYAISAMYAGFNRGDAFRPKLDIYGEPVLNKNPKLIDGPHYMVTTQGQPIGDELMALAQDAQFDLQGVLNRRSRPGGLKLGSSLEEQNITYLNEKYHGDYVKENKDMLLQELKLTPDAPARKEVFKRFFSAATLSAKERLLMDKVHGPTFQRLLKGVNR